MGHDFFRRPGDDHLSAVNSGFRAKVDDMIRTFDDIKVVLNHNDGIARIDEALEDFQQHTGIIKVEAGSGLVEDEQAGLAVLPGPLWFGEQVANELEALAFTAAQSIERLAESQVAQADIGEKLKPLDYVLGLAIVDCKEKRDRL